MSAFGTPTVLQQSQAGGIKFTVITTTGSASYDTGGSVIDLSLATLGAWTGYSEIYGVAMLGISATASSKYSPVFIAAAAGAPATGKIKLHDSSAAADAEVTGATDISGTTFTLLVTGR